MWLLPLDFGAARATLPPGRYRLPWYHDAAARQRLVQLVARLVPEIAHVVALPWAALDLPGALCQPERTLVVVHVPAGVGPDELDARLARLGGAWQLLYGAEPAEGAHGWQERFVQPALVDLVRRNLAQPDHPLAALQIAHLPVTFAARLTSDMVALLDLLEGAVRHRLRYAHLGTDPAEYRASVRLVAGRRLARRLLTLDGDALQLGLEVLVAGRGGLDGLPTATVRRGGRALERVGLARVVAGDVLLGPLARRLDDVVLRGAFLAAVPVEAWTVEARRWAIHGAAVVAETTPPAARPPAPRAHHRVWADVVAGLRAEVAGHHDPRRDALAAALDVLAEVVQVPPWVERLPAGLARRVVQALRGIDFALDGQPLPALAQAIAGVLRHQASRAPAQPEPRREATLALTLLVTAESPASLRLALGAVVADSCWDAVLTAGDGASVEAAVVQAAAARTLVPTPSAAAATLDALALYEQGRAGGLAGLAEAYAALRQTYLDLGAEREAAVVQARQGRLRAAGGDDAAAQACFDAAIAVFDRLGDAHDRAIALGDVGRLRARAGDLEGALAVHEARLKTLDELGARRGRAFALGDVARVLARMGRLDEALALHRRSLEDFETLRDARGQASVRGAIARILAARGDLDEAITLHRQRLKVAVALDDCDGVAVTRYALGMLERRRADEARTPTGRQRHLRSARADLAEAWRLNRTIGHARGLQDAALAYAATLRALGDDGAADATLRASAAQLRAAGMADAADRLLAQ